MTRWALRCLIGFIREESLLLRLLGKETPMETPEMLRGQSLKRLLQGLVVGAVATMIVGFSWGGWMLGGTAKKIADTQASSAVVAALAPICVAQFQSAADAPSQL